MLHNIDGNLLEITDLTSTTVSGNRRFSTRNEVQVPSGSNIEGFAVTPALTGAQAIGDHWAFFTDDDNASGALRWFKQLPSRLVESAGDDQTAPAGTIVPIPPAVRADDPFSNPLPSFAIDFAVSMGGGSVTGGNASTNASGIASVDAWTLGPTAGQNALTAAGAGLTGSPQTFTATATDPAGVPGLDPDRLGLGAPVPNPGREETRVSFRLPRAAFATMSVFDVQGQLVKTIARDAFPAGRHEAVWDGRRPDGSRARAGVYFYCLRSGDSRATRRGLLLP